MSGNPNKQTEITTSCIYIKVHDLIIGLYTHQGLRANHDSR